MNRKPGMANHFDGAMQVPVQLLLPVLFKIVPAVCGRAID